MACSGRRPKAGSGTDGKELTRAMRASGEKRDMIVVGLVTPPCLKYALLLVLRDTGRKRGREEHAAD